MSKIYTTGAATLLDFINNGARNLQPISNGGQVQQPAQRETEADELSRLRAESQEWERRDADRLATDAAAQGRAEALEWTKEGNKA